MKKSNYIYYVLAGIVGLYIYKKIYPLYKDLKGNAQLPIKNLNTTLMASGEILSTPAPVEQVDYKVKYSISGTRKKLPTQI
jgi:xanthosine utilization system XapX-like protein